MEIDYVSLLNEFEEEESKKASDLFQSSILRLIKWIMRLHQQAKYSGLTTTINKRKVRCKYKMCNGKFPDQCPKKRFTGCYYGYRRKNGKIYTKSGLEFL
jgi:hypothetical protein